MTTLSDVQCNYSAWNYSN